MSVDESVIPEDDRIPRFTSASWKYESGAIGHLEHGVALQGTEFSTELTVFADGYQLKLTDPYNRPTVTVRRPGSDKEELHTFYNDDPFLSELSTFIDAATLGEQNSSLPILSSYADAVHTYDMTWAIRRASERTRCPKPTIPSKPPTTTAPTLDRTSLLSSAQVVASMVHEPTAEEIIPVAV